MWRADGGGKRGLDRDQDAVATRCLLLGGRETISHYSLVQCGTSRLRGELVLSHTRFSAHHRDLLGAPDRAYLDLTSSHSLDRWLPLHMQPRERSVTRLDWFGSKLHMSRLSDLVVACSSWLIPLPVLMQEQSARGRSSDCAMQRRVVMVGRQPSAVARRTLDAPWCDGGVIRRQTAARALLEARSRSRNATDCSSRPSTLQQRKAAQPGRAGREGEGKRDRGFLFRR